MVHGLYMCHMGDRISKETKDFLNLRVGYQEPLCGKMQQCRDKIIA